jgi:hypothetical protein
MSRTHRASSTLIPSYNRLHRKTECDRRYYYAYVAAIEPLHEDETKLRAGQALHAGLDVLHRIGWNALPHAEQAVADTWAGYKAGPYTAYMTEAHLVGVLRGYGHWSLEQEVLTPLALMASDVESSPAFRGGTYDVDEAGRIVMVEPALDVEIAPGLVVQVVVDMLAQTAGGDLRVVDHKTTADYLGDTLTKRVRYSHQLRLYTLGMEALLGRTLDGGLVNGIYMGEYALKDRSTAVRFARYEFDYTRSQLAETLAWAQHGRDQAMADEAARGHDEAQWLQHGGRHCGWCPFSQLCDCAGPMRAGRLKALYRPRQKDDDEA